MLARRHGPPDLDFIRSDGLGVFHHDNGIGPGRQGRTSDDFHALTGLNGFLLDLANRNGADDLEIARACFAGPEKIGRPDGIAVHGGAGKRRQVVGSLNRLGEHRTGQFRQILSGRGPQRMKRLNQPVKLPHTEHLEKLGIHSGLQGNLD